MRGSEQRGSYHPRGRAPSRGGRHDWWWSLDGPFIGRMTRCASGILLIVEHAYSGRLEGMAVLEASDWACMTPGERERVVMGFFKKPSGAGGAADKSGPPPADKDLAKSAPTLLSYLSSDTWPDGEARQRSTLIVFCEEGVFKVCLSDKDSSTTLWASSKTFSGIATAVEGRLTEEVADWRRSRTAKKKA